VDCECDGDCGNSSTGTRGARCSTGDGTCKGEDFCRVPEGWCGDSDDGRCVPMPAQCNMNMNRVCGCNGVAYDTECDAFSVGVSVDYTGSC